MSNYEELIAQRDELNKQIAEALSTERKDAIAHVKALVGKFDLKPSDVFGARNKTSGSKVPAKYRDANTGATWSGRGFRPKWLPQTGDISSYLI